MARFQRLLLAVAPLVMAAGVASAADNGEVEQLRDQLRATVLQLRQLQDQQASAPPPVAAPPPDAGKLAALKSQLRAARGHAAQLQAELDKARSDSAAQTAAATNQAAELERFKAAFAQASDQNRALTGERDRLKAQLAQMTTVATACQQKNLRLAAFSETLLSALRQTGRGRQLRAYGDAFIGFERVQLENLEQDREDESRADRCDPRVDAAPAPAARGG